MKQEPQRQQKNSQLAWILALGALVLYALGFVLNR